MANIIIIIGKVTKEPVVVTHKKIEKYYFEVLDKDNSMHYQCFFKKYHISFEEDLKLGKIIKVHGTEKVDNDDTVYVEAKDCYYERVDKCQEA